MKIGILADIHDNVDNLRYAIRFFNEAQCKAVLLAGDFVSPLERHLDITSGVEQGSRQNKKQQ